jgi:hypothetical protein
VIFQRHSALSIRDRDIAAMPIHREPEFSSPLRIACFAVMGVTVFAAFFGALLS